MKKPCILDERNYTESSDISGTTTAITTISSH